MDESDSDTDSDDTIPVTSDEEENMPNVGVQQLVFAFSVIAILTNASLVEIYVYV